MSLPCGRSTNAEAALRNDTTATSRLKNDVDDPKDAMDKAA